MVLGCPGMFNLARLHGSMSSIDKGRIMLSPDNMYD